MPPEPLLAFGVPIVPLVYGTLYFAARDQFPRGLKCLTSRDAIVWTTLIGLTMALGAVHYLTRKSLTAPALTRYQKARSIDPSRRELVGEHPAHWIKAVPTTTCEQCGIAVNGNQWAFKQHQQTKKCLAPREVHG